METPECHAFTFADFDTEVNKNEAMIRALNRMVASGRIANLCIGKNFKFENTTFSNLFRKWN